MKNKFVPIRTFEGAEVIVEYDREQIVSAYLPKLDLLGDVITLREPPSGEFAVTFPEISGVMDLHITAALSGREGRRSWVITQRPHVWIAALDIPKLMD